MIRNFWVKNYLSISDKQELNFVTKSSASELAVEMPDGTCLYKLGVLYGSNASGKSNMLWALDEVFHLLTYPKANANMKISRCIPFVLSKDEPTEMFVSFYAEGIRYDYQVSFDANHIHSEELNYYPKGSKALFYERYYKGQNLQAEIKFGVSLRMSQKTQDSIRENTLNNHSVLSVCLKNTFKEDIEPLAKLHSYLMSHYHNVDGDTESRGIVEILKNAYRDDNKHKFFRQMLKKADLNITDFRPILEDHSLSQDFREHVQNEDFPTSLKEDLLRPTVESVVFENHSEKGVFDVPLKLQSKGTIKFIRILDTLYDLISGNHIYYLDELGEDLHYDLLFYYLNIFLYNSDKSQLLITSQETTLLSQDIINDNRGVVWFVDKNKDTASSEYSRGDSYGLHKNLSLYNSYRIGKLGAKPELGSIFVDLED